LGKSKVKEEKDLGKSSRRGRPGGPGLTEGRGNRGDKGKRGSHTVRRTPPPWGGKGRKASPTAGI